MKKIIKLYCGLMAVALAACTGDELEQVEQLQRPVGERKVSVKAYAPKAQANSRLTFEEKNDGSIALLWTQGDVFTAVIGEDEEVNFSYNNESKEFTAMLPTGVTLTDNTKAYYPAYTGTYSTNLSQQTGKLDSEVTYMEGTYAQATNSFSFHHSTAILKASFTGLPAEASVSSVKVVAEPYNITIPYINELNLFSGIYIYLPAIAKDKELTFFVETANHGIYTATKTVQKDGGIQKGKIYNTTIALRQAELCNLPIGTEFNNVVKTFLNNNTGLKHIKFIANSETTGTEITDSNGNGCSAYMVENGETLEIHTHKDIFMFSANCTNMFHNLARIISIDFGNHINTSNVTNMSYMFWSCDNLTFLDLSSFNTANVTDMSWMFCSCDNLASLDLSSFNTANVTNMRLMFNACSSLTSLDLSSFNTTNVTDMLHMFYNCSSLTSLDLSSFNTTNVTKMNEMFYRCSSLTRLDLSSFNTANVTDMHWMFEECSSLVSLDLSSFNTANVTNMEWMFGNCVSLTSLDLSSFNTSNVTDMKYLLRNCPKLTSLNLSSFDFSQVSDGNLVDMFKDLGTSATNQPIPVFVKDAATKTLLEGTNASTGINSSYVEIIDASLPAGSDFNAAITSIIGTNNVTSIVFEANSNETGGTQLGSSLAYAKVLNGNTLKVYTAMSEFVLNKICTNMFSNLNQITSIDFGDKINTSNVTGMLSMFKGCSSLTELDLSGFNMAKVTDMTMMFYNCSALASLKLDNFHTIHLGAANMMFQGCSALTSLDLSSLNFDNVGSFMSIFEGLGASAINQPIPVKLTQTAYNKLSTQDTGINLSYAQYVDEAGNPY